MGRLASPGGKTKGQGTDTEPVAGTVAYNTITVNGKPVAEKDLDSAIREKLRDAARRIGKLCERGKLDENAGQSVTIISSTTVNGKPVAEKDMDPTTREILRNAMRQLESIGTGQEADGNGELRRIGEEEIRGNKKVPCKYCGTLAGPANTECPICGMSLRP